MLFTHRIAETTNFNGNKVLIDPLFKRVEIEVMGEGDDAQNPRRWGRYSHEREVITLWPWKAGGDIVALRGAFAHEAGHAHHHWFSKNRRWIWDHWKEEVWPSLVKEGLIDGYAAVSAMEGWAEIYRLSIGCSFERGRATKGEWQFSPAATQALETWAKLIARV